MYKKDLINLLKELSKGFLEKKIDGELYARITESLIVTNLNLVPNYEDFADFLAQYHPSPQNSELYGNQDLIRKIKKIFKI